MQQVFQDLGTGRTSVTEVPAPQVRPRHVLVRTVASVISAGTERMLVDFARASLIGKARQQPERVMDVLSKVQTDGLVPTVHAVRAKLGQPLPLGYASAGVVVQLGEGVRDVDVGQLVATNGPHAELACVPQNYCVPVPQSTHGPTMAPEHAAFASIGAVALQGLRLVNPTLGERIVVTGLGLVGLLTVQLLRANGCHVLGLDFAEDRLRLAELFGAATVDLTSGADPVTAAVQWSRGHGVDAVIIAAATDSDQPVQQAAAMCRAHGRIVLVGTTGLSLRRADFYEKELTFQVSCSYGPGRHDPLYEERGQDYPVGHVRWSAGRNQQAFLDAVAAGALDMEPLISHRFDIVDAPTAYDRLSGDSGSLGIVLSYPHVDATTPPSSVVKTPAATSIARGRKGRTVAVVGAGNYSRQVLLPALAGAGANLHMIASRGGADARHAADQFGFACATTDVDAVFSEPSIDAVIITTRHDSHAHLALRALEAGKHVYVEKPLAISGPQLDELHSSYSELAEPPILMVGFNRRFAPLTRRLKSALEGVNSPKVAIATVNAGPIPRDHWVHDPTAGGGRIIGEACHHIDLLRHLMGSAIVNVDAKFLGGMEDTATIVLTFADGSVGTVHYIATGNGRYPKERIEVFGGGRVYTLDNFRRLRAYGAPNPGGRRITTQDKGHVGSIRSFVDAVGRGGPSPIPYNEILEVSRATIAAAAQ
jgi:predicted dehydrogenase/threonine dehydrogenase-like Zn-dependent dehydrogenase